MNGSTVATIGALPSAIIGLIFCLAVWHWLESGEGAMVGVKMAWQDVQVTFSCRSLDTTTRFLMRKYEDYAEDRIIFAAPGWKRFICPLYETDVPRSKSYRSTLKDTSYASLTKDEKLRLDTWFKVRKLTLKTWYPKP